MGVFLVGLNSTQILVELNGVQESTPGVTLAHFVLWKIRKPVWSREIDRFGDIEAQIEAAVVSTVQSDDELSSLLANFGNGNVWNLLLEEIRVDYRGFVTQKLGALQKLLREVFLNEIFEFPRILPSDAVPHLG